MDESRLAQEKKLAVGRYIELRENGHNRESAAALLAASTGFPMLSTAGHAGRSLLSGHNLDNWLRSVRKGRSLRRNWRNGRAPFIPGGGTFWSAFFCLYLSPAKMSAKEAYRRATKLAKPSDVPSPSQCQRVVSRRLDPVLVALCRSDPLPAAEVGKPAITVTAAFTGRASKSASGIRTADRK